MGWSKDWIRNLKPGNTFEPFILQFANIERIEHNDAVYIFDEVGTGKTISSGLTAWHYIYNNQPSQNNDNFVDCVVITINSNIVANNGETKGSFAKKWEDSLCLFNEKEINSRKVKIIFINNDYRNISNLIGKEIGFLIIDEAHTFNGYDTQRLENLRNLKAKKILFLTATPFKIIDKGFDFSLELMGYITTVRRVLGNENYYIDFKEYFKNDNGIIISNTFDKKAPVTRYFKDTLMSLKNIDVNSKPQEPKKKRQLTEIITSDSMKIVDKSQKIIERIIADRQKQGDQEEPHRYVIFTRYKKGEEDIIEKLLENDFIHFDDKLFEVGNNKQTLRYTFKIINGETKDIGKFTFKREGNQLIPDVLVITSQIAEQGIDLPSYSHIINLDIPANPASLEQRFGRVDRLDKKDSPLYTDIYMWYIVSRDCNDKYTNNLIEAMHTYMRNLQVMNFPSKNILFDGNKTLIKYYNEEKKRRKNYIEQIEATLNNLISDAKKKDELYDVIYINRNLLERAREIDPDFYSNMNDLWEFIMNNNSYYKIIRDASLRDELKINKSDDFVNLLKDLIKHSSKEVNNEIIDINLIDKIIKQSDSIFYIDGETINIYDTWKDCALTIYQNESFKEYKEEYLEYIKNIQ